MRMMRMKRHSNTKAEVLGFSAGALVGAGLALLYAPKKGNEMREQVSQATGDAVVKMKSMAAGAQEKLNRTLRKGQHFAEEKAETWSTEAPEKEEFNI